VAYEPAKISRRARCNLPGVIYFRTTPTPTTTTTTTDTQMFLQQLVIPALARALWKFPRLSINNSHVQLFTSDYDFPYVDMDSIVLAKTSRDYFSPWIQFGSNFQDSTILPNVQMFPFIDFLHCLCEWSLYQIRMRVNTSDRIESMDSALNQTCYLFTITVWNNDTWDNLIPQIIWRGSDFPFLHTFRQKVLKDPIQSQKYLSFHVNWLFK
jgi:hypothetical protein